MKKQYIGISSRIISNSFERLNVTTTYLNLIKKSDYIPIILPIDLNEDNLNELLKLCNRFLITGGDDINPQKYSDTIDKHSNYDNRIDDLDYKIIEHALINLKPIFGICRGFQVLNVYFNGTLVQHLNSSSLLSHFDSAHYINYIDNPKINLKFTSSKFLVKSYHHQAIDKLGKDLISIFLSEDYYIEGFIHKQLPIIATQWHIEQDLDGELTKKLWNYFETM